MSISTSAPAQPPPKKRGMGCLGCGCLLLALLAGLFVVVIGLLAYGTYSTAMAMSSTTPVTLPTFAGTEDLYARARQKLADFDHDVVNHQAATVSFSADELNSMIAHNPDMSAKHIQAFVSMTDSEARLQSAFPTDGVSRGLITGRYTSFDVSFEVHFDQVTKEVNIIPHSLQVWDRPILGPAADNPQANQVLLRVFVPLLTENLNTAIRKSSDGAALLDEAQSIEVKGGQLMLQTR
jgi:hypothetical protein